MGKSRLKSADWKKPIEKCRWKNIKRINYTKYFQNEWQCMLLAPSFGIAVLLAKKMHVFASDTVCCLLRYSCKKQKKL